MKIDRREFLWGAAWSGAAALAAGCRGMADMRPGGSMAGFRCAPMKTIRIGFAGLGGRGTSALKRISQIPGCVVTGICDLRQERLDACSAHLKAEGCAKAKEYLGSEAYKAMCAADDVDVVYVATGWQMHAPIGCRALENGKHAFVEVPAAMTLDECWEFVELAERNKVHCMQLENCCYGEAELLCLNLCRKGLLGELVHGEAAYIHDLRNMNYADDPTIGKPNRGYYGHWRLKWNVKHMGNQYPTHGLGPVCQYMNVNRGDRLDCLCTMDSRQANFEAWGRSRWPKGDWHHEQKVDMGDMSTTLVRTELGRTIMIQHDVSSPRPYTRLNLVSGTRGIFRGCYFPEDRGNGLLEPAFTQGCGCRFGWTTSEGGPVHSFFDSRKTEEMRKKYMHPYWHAAGEIGKKIGGHGGMDFLMDLRWVYCLQNGLPMDMDVYDLATWCSICELSETSFRKRRFMDVPDFTRGGWRTAEPLGIVTLDPAKMNLGA